MSQVQLYRYDLTQGMAAQFSPMLLGQYVEAVWHTAIVVYGKEYYFDGGVGIVEESRPGFTRFGTPHRTEVLGSTSKSLSEFRQWVSGQRAVKFGPTDYNLLQRNCNHFSDDAIQFLLGPSHRISDDVRLQIDRLFQTPLGAMIRPMLENAVNGGAATPNAAPQPSTSGPPAAASTAREPAMLNEADLEELNLQFAIVESSVGEPGCLSAAQFQTALETLRTILENIAAFPNEARYRCLNQTGTAFKNKLLADTPEAPLHELVSLILRHVGFQNNVEKKMLVAERVNSKNLAQIQTLVRQAVDSNTHRTAKASDASPSIPAPAVSSINPLVQYIPLSVAFNTTGATPRWTPLPVGGEHGNPLFSVLLQPDPAGNLTCGKASAKVRAEMVEVSIHYADHAGQEKSMNLHAPLDLSPPSFEVRPVELSRSPMVLCTWGVTESFVWVPLALLSRSTPVASEKILFTARSPNVTVCRACHGSGVHPGTCRMNSSNREVVLEIPYGGKALNVNHVGEVLCDVSQLPLELRNTMEVLEKEDRQIREWIHSQNAPIHSIEALLQWKATSMNRTTVELFSPQRRASTTTGGSRGIGNFLVCHDYKGGYLNSDLSFFEFSSAKTSANGSSGCTITLPVRTGNLSVADDAYTVSYWQHIDMFVYFSHARVTIPPQEWIDAAHRHGVPCLGTFITEWEDGRAEWERILSDPSRMGSVIAKLADVAVHYGFEGYLLNVENEISAQHSRRLQYFVTMLRKTLRDKKQAAGADCSRVSVIWYDAVTTEGKLSFQNNLTEKNRPFFDAADGIFLNYFWQPPQLSTSLNHAPPERLKEVLVGLDCFGRGTYGNGGFHCDKALAEIESRKMGVALFAPGWTRENAANGKRRDEDGGFVDCDTKLWSSIAPRFDSHLPEVRVAISEGMNKAGAVLFHSCFAQGAGSVYVIPQFPAAATTVATKPLVSFGGWTQRSRTHFLPSGFRAVLDQPEGLSGSRVGIELLVTPSPNLARVATSRAVLLHGPRAVEKHLVYQGDSSVMLDLNHNIGTSLDCFANLLFTQLRVGSNLSTAVAQVQIIWKFEGAASEYHAVRVVGHDGASPASTQISVLAESRLSAEGPGWQTTQLNVALGGVNDVVMSALQVSLSTGSETAKLVVGSIRIQIPRIAEGPPLLTTVPAPQVMVMEGSPSCPCSLLQMEWSVPKDSAPPATRPVVAFAKSNDGDVLFLGEYDLPLTLQPPSETEESSPFVITAPVRVSGSGDRTYFSNISFS